MELVYQFPILGQNAISRIKLPVGGPTHPARMAGLIHRLQLNWISSFQRRASVQQPIVLDEALVNCRWMIAGSQLEKKSR
jgi:hypothetical protein